MKVGCLGAGQLSLMLSEAAPGLKIEFRSFAGSLSDVPAVLDFARGLDAIVFESDFLAFSSLSSAHLPFVPRLSLIESLSDKIVQKEMATLAGIPSAEFRVFDDDQKQLSSWIQKIRADFQDEIVFKWAKGGYDGKGVHIFRGDVAATLQFLQQGLSQKTRIFAERRIRFKRELSQIGVRSIRGEWATYPLVISEQENGVCRIAYGPASSFGVSKDIERQAAEFSRAFAEATDMKGVFTLELFETEEGQILLNEVAPRVHNTGHFSLQGAETSQFENHLRAVTGMPLGSTFAKAPFFMLNLLGSRASGLATAPKRNPPEGGVVKWYLKSEMRLGRKLGHVNWCGFVATEFQRLKSAALQWESEWANEKV